VATAIAVLERPTDPVGALKGLLTDPTLAEAFDPATDYTGWLLEQPDLTVGFALSDVRPRRGDLLGVAVGSNQRICRRRHRHRGSPRRATHRRRQTSRRP
jgi:hypothetical protein